MHYKPKAGGERSTEAKELCEGTQIDKNTSVDFSPQATGFLASVDSAGLRERPCHEFNNVGVYSVGAVDGRRERGDDYIGVGCGLATAPVRGVKMVKWRPSRSH